VLGTASYRSAGPAGFNVYAEIGFLGMKDHPHEEALQQALDVAEGCMTRCFTHPAHEGALPDFRPK
jgi:hypothetical protein